MAKRQPSLSGLMRSPPALHRVDGRLSSRWQLDDAALEYIAETVTPGMRTVETGAGLSTIVFALSRAHHTSIAPDQALMDRIEAYCRHAGVPTDRLNLIAGPSEQVLPGLEVGPVDFALIDGLHGFPAPFVDALYLSRRLRVGGRLMVDDLKIWTAELLARYLRSEPGWALVQETWDTAVFEKRSEDVLNGEWNAQPFVAQRSARYSFPAKLRLLRRMLRTGDFAPVRAALRRLRGPPRS